MKRNRTGDLRYIACTVFATAAIESLLVPGIHSGAVYTDSCCHIRILPLCTARVVVAQLSGPKLALIGKTGHKHLLTTYTVSSCCLASGKSVEVGQQRELELSNPASRAGVH